MSQASSNPFKYSNTNKRYHTYNYYLNRRFGKRCAKITLDFGFTCPNIDGTKGVGGCIYCSGGSASLNCRSVPSIKEQFARGVEMVQKKWDVSSFIAYMQAYTNTHTSPKRLKEAISEAMALPDVVMLDIATRADCLENEKLEIINEASKIMPITLELGLQSSSDKTAKIINRCHTYAELEDAVQRIKKIAPSVKIGLHIINGLPEENYDDIIKLSSGVILKFRVTARWWRSIPVHFFRPSAASFESPMQEKYTLAYLRSGATSARVILIKLLITFGSLTSPRAIASSFLTASFILPLL